MFKEIFGPGRNESDSEVNYEELNLTRGCRVHGGPIRSMIELSNGKLASASSDGTIGVWDPKTFELESGLRSSEDYLGLTELSTKEHVVYSTASGVIGMWDYGGRGGFNFMKIDGWVFDLVEVKRAKLAAAAPNGSVLMIDMDKGEVVDEYKGHELEVLSIDKLSKNRIVTGSADGTIKVWDLKKGKVLRTLEGHEKAVRSVSAISGGRILSGSPDRSVKIWNPDTGECEVDIVVGGSFSPVIEVGEGSMAIGYLDGGVHFWEKK